LGTDARSSRRRRRIVVVVVVGVVVGVVGVDAVVGCVLHELLQEPPADMYVIRSDGGGGDVPMQCLSYVQEIAARCVDF
jgi:hypothetical protein